MSLDDGLQTALCDPFSAQAAWTWTLAASRAPSKPACGDPRTWETSNLVFRMKLVTGIQTVWVNA